MNEAVLIDLAGEQVALSAPPLCPTCAGPIAVGELELEGELPAGADWAARFGGEPGDDVRVRCATWACVNDASHPLIQPPGPDAILRP